MAKAKTVKPAKTVQLSAHDRVLEVLMSGQPVEKAYFDKMFGAMSYKISAYILYCKNAKTKAVIRAKKDGRKVVSYQLMNPAEVMPYWTERGIVPNIVQNLSDLNAEPVETIATQTESVEV